MRQDYLLLLGLLLLFVNQCQSHSRYPTFSSGSSLSSSEYRDRGVSTPGLVDFLWKNFRNSTGSLLESQQRETRSGRRCLYHSDCSRHEHCSCSNYCRNTYNHQCNGRKRRNSVWSEEEDKRELVRSQRDCGIRKHHDARSDATCESHSDCGCGRHCSCHGFCTYIFSSDK